MLQNDNIVAAHFIHFFSRNKDTGSGCLGPTAAAGGAIGIGEVEGNCNEAADSSDLLLPAGNSGTTERQKLDESYLHNRNSAEMYLETDKPADSYLQQQKSGDLYLGEQYSSSMFSVGSDYAGNSSNNVRQLVSGGGQLKLAASATQRYSSPAGNIENPDYVQRFSENYSKYNIGDNKIKYDSHIHNNQLNPLSLQSHHIMSCSSNSGTENAQFCRDEQLTSAHKMSSLRRNQHGQGYMNENLE